MIFPQTLITLDINRAKSFAISGCSSWMHDETVSQVQTCASNCLTEVAA
jgi:hypothetical protein